MYLTEDEFKVLLGIKDGLNNIQIEEKYGVHLGMNSPYIIALAKKYGVSLESYTIRKDIREKADISKIKIVSKEKMPYFNYIGNELADYIDINKKDIEQLIKYFKNISDEACWHTHRLYRTEDGIGTTLQILDLKTNKLTHIRSTIDGNEYIGEDKKEIY